MMSAITSAPPRYGTWVASKPAPRRNFSALICTALPTPTEPNEIDPGFTLASLMKSCTVFQGRIGGTIITLALEPIISTPARSLRASKVRSVKIAGAMVSAEECASTLYPSGSARATIAVPSVPPAPGRFSTTIGWPSSADSLSKNSRGTTSVALPAPNGIVALISRDGQVSAWLPVAMTNEQNTMVKRNNRYIGILNIYRAIRCKNRSAASLHQRELQQQRALEQRKIVVGNHRQYGVAFRRHKGVDAF